MGHEVAKSQVVSQTHTTSLTELHLDLIKYAPMTFSKVVRLLGYMQLHPPQCLKVAHKSQWVFEECTQRYKP